MLALNIYDTFYQRSGAQWKGIGQAKAVVFFLLVIVIALIQLYFTPRKEVQQLWPNIMTALFPAPAALWMCC